MTDKALTKEQITMMLILKYGSLEDAYWTKGAKFVGIEHEIVVDYLRERYAKGDTLTNLCSTVKIET